MSFTSYKNDVPQSNVIKRHHDVKNRRPMSLKRLDDVINLWQKQARSHATKTGVHHLKNGVHHIYTFQKCTIWTNEKPSIFRLYNNAVYCMGVFA